MENPGRQEQMTTLARIAKKPVTMIMWVGCRAGARQVISLTAGLGG